jgi:hypothetical protein
MSSDRNGFPPSVTASRCPQRFADARPFANAANDNVRCDRLEPRWLSHEDRDQYLFERAAARELSGDRDD